MVKLNKDAVADYAKKMKDIKLRVPYTPGKFDEMVILFRITMKR